MQLRMALTSYIVISFELDPSLEKKETPSALRRFWQAGGGSHIIRSRLPFRAGGLWGKLTAQGRVMVRCVFFAYSSSLASAVAWPVSKCRLKDEKGRLHTLGDEL